MRAKVLYGEIIAYNKLKLLDTKEVVFFVPFFGSKVGLRGWFLSLDSSQPFRIIEHVMFKPK